LKHHRGRYPFVAIDRVTRWVFVELYADQTDRSSVDFPCKVHKTCPVKIVKLLTDNGSQFTDRFIAKTGLKNPAACTYTIACASNARSSTA